MCSTLFRDTDHAKRLAEVWLPASTTFKAKKQDDDSLAESTRWLPAGTAGTAEGQDSSSELDDSFLLQPMYIRPSATSTPRAAPNDSPLREWLETSEDSVIIVEPNALPGPVEVASNNAPSPASNFTSPQRRTLLRALFHPLFEPSYVSGYETDSPALNVSLASVDDRAEVTAEMIMEIKVNILFMYLLMRKLITRTQQKNDALMQRMDQELTTLGKAVIAKLKSIPPGQTDLFSQEKDIFAQLREDVWNALEKDAAFRAGYRLYASDIEEMQQAVDFFTARLDDPVSTFNRKFVPKPAETDKLFSILRQATAEMCEFVTHVYTVLKFTEREWDRSIVLGGETHGNVSDYILGTARSSRELVQGVLDYCYKFIGEVDAGTSEKFSEIQTLCERTTKIVSAIENIVAVEYKMVAVLFTILLARELQKRQNVSNATTSGMSEALKKLLEADAMKQDIPVDALQQLKACAEDALYNGERSIFVSSDETGRLSGIETERLLQAVVYFQQDISDPHSLKYDISDSLTSNHINEISWNRNVIQKAREHVAHIQTVLVSTNGEWNQSISFNDNGTQTEMEVADYLTDVLSFYADLGEKSEKYFAARQNEATSTDASVGAGTDADEAARQEEITNAFIVEEAMTICRELRVTTVQCRNTIAAVTGKSDAIADLVGSNLRRIDSSITAEPHATSMRVSKGATMTTESVDGTLDESVRWIEDSVLADKQVSHSVQPGSPADTAGVHSVSGDSRAFRASRGGAGIEMTPGQYNAFAGNDMRAARSANAPRYGVPFRTLDRSALPETPHRSNNIGLSASAVHGISGSASHAVDSGEIDTTHFPDATVTGRVTVRAPPELNLTPGDIAKFPISVKKQDFDEFYSQVLPVNNQSHFAEIGTFGTSHSVDIAMHMIAELQDVTPERRSAILQTRLDDLNAATRVWVAVKNAERQQVDCYMSVLRMGQSSTVPPRVLKCVVTDSLCEYFPSIARQQLDKRFGEKTKKQEEDWLTPLRDALKWHRHSLRHWLDLETQTPRDAFSFGQPYATNGARARFYAGLVHKMIAVIQQAVASHYEGLIKHLKVGFDDLVCRKILRQRLVRLSESDWSDSGIIRRTDDEGMQYSSPSLRTLIASLNSNMGKNKNFGNLSDYFSNTALDDENPVEKARALAVNKLVQATSCLCTFMWLYGDPISMCGYGSISSRPSQQRGIVWNIVDESDLYLPGSALSAQMLLPFLESAHSPVKLKVPSDMIPPSEVGQLEKTARVFASVDRAFETSAKTASPAAHRRIESERARKGVPSGAAMAEAKLDFIKPDQSDAATFDACVLLCPSVVFSATATLVCDEAAPLVVVLKQENEMLRAPAFSSAADASLTRV